MKRLIRNIALVLIFFNLVQLLNFMPKSTCYASADTQAPTAPSNLVVESKSDTNVTLTWGTSDDDTGVTEYYIYNGTARVGSTSGGTSYVVSGLTPNTTYNFTVYARDMANNISNASNAVAVTTNALGDIQAPTTPTNLVLVSKTFTTVTLSWSASTDNIAVTIYDVYFDNIKAGSTDGSNGYTVTGLMPNTSYNFTVLARDGAGNASAASSILTVKTDVDTQSPTTPTNLQVVSKTCTSVNLTWTASTDNAGIADYEIYKNSSLVGFIIGDTNYTVTGLDPKSTYSFSIKAKDVAGNLSTASTSVSVTTNPDTQSPTAPTNLNVVTKTSTTVTFSWTAAVDDIGVTGYDIYKGTSRVGSTTGATTYTVTGLSPNTAYSFTVNAKDAVGNVSVASAALSATTSVDVQTPTIPASLTSTAKTKTSVTLTWTAATDDSGTVIYDIYNESAKVGYTSALSYAVTGLNPNTTYTFTVRARDGSGNVSGDSNSITVTTLVDTQAPTAPTGLRVSSQTTSGILLNWYASSDDVGVTGYDIYRGNVLIASTTGAAATSYKVTGLDPNTAYTFTVRARDGSGNISGDSNSITVITLADTQAPTAPTRLSVLSQTTSGILLSWSISSDDVGVTGYDIYKGNVLTASTTGAAATSYTITGLDPNTTYTFTVRAKDGSGNISADSNAVTAYVDTLQPDAPTGLTANSVTVASVVLTWTEAADNVGVTGYDIYRGTSLVASTTGATTYTVTGLSPNTVYSFTVKAKDAAGNVSVVSDAILATTSPDVQAPTIPASLTATVKTKTSVTLTWTAATDDSGTVIYDIYNGSAKVGYTSEVSYTVTGLNPNTTYTFTVRAKDGLGNISADSNAVTATTEKDTDNPTYPVGLCTMNKTTTSVTLYWKAASDDVGVVGYDIYMNNILIGSTSGETSFVITGLSQNTEYIFTVRARDVSGNVSEDSNILAAKTDKDLQPPDAPTDLKSTEKTITTVTLSWSAGSDDLAVGGYDIYLGNSKIASVSSDVASYIVTGLKPNTEYCFTVKTRDKAGNVSISSNALTIITNLDTQVPSVPVGLGVISKTATTVTLFWTASTDNSGVDAYDIYSGNILVGSTVGSTYAICTITGLSPNTKYNFTVVARDLAGNTSQFSVPISVTTNVDDSKEDIPTVINQEQLKFMLSNCLVNRLEAFKVIYNADSSDIENQVMTIISQLTNENMDKILLKSMSLQKLIEDGHVTLNFTFSYDDVANYSATLKTLEELRTFLYNRFTNRELDKSGTANANVIYLGDINNDEVSTIINSINEENSYLKYSVSTSAAIQDNVCSKVISITASYLTSKEQEDFIDKTVDFIVSNLINSKMADDEKEKAIHDYILGKLTFKDDRSIISNAYTALYSGAENSMGYSMLAYKMLNAAGIENIIVQATDDTYTWNLVRINGSWYNLDCAMDDGISGDKGYYKYYNLSDTEMSKYHKRDSLNDIQCNRDYIHELSKMGSSRFDSIIKDISGDQVFKSINTFKNNEILNLMYNNVVVKEGDEISLINYKIDSSLYSGKLIWKTSDSSIAEIENGVIKAKSGGTAVVCAVPLMAECGQPVFCTVHVITSSSEEGIREQKLEASKTSQFNNQAVVPQITIDSNEDINTTTTIIDCYDEFKDSVKMIGHPIEVETTSKFNMAEIGFKLSSEELASIDLDSLVIYWIDERNGNIVPQATKVDKVNGTVSATVLHFSKYFVGTDTGMSDASINIGFIIDSVYSDREQVTQMKDKITSLIKGLKQYANLRLVFVDDNTEDVNIVNEMYVLRDSGNKSDTKIENNIETIFSNVNALNEPHDSRPPDFIFGCDEHYYQAFVTSQGILESYNDYTYQNGQKSNYIMLIYQADQLSYYDPYYWNKSDDFMWTPTGYTSSYTTSLISYDEFDNGDLIDAILRSQSDTTDTTDGFSEEIKARQWQGISGDEYISVTDSMNSIDTTYLCEWNSSMSSVYPYKPPKNYYINATLAKKQIEEVLGYYGGYWHNMVKSCQAIVDMQLDGLIKGSDEYWGHIAIMVNKFNSMQHGGGPQSDHTVFVVPTETSGAVSGFYISSVSLTEGLKGFERIPNETLLQTQMRMLLQFENDFLEYTGGPATAEGYNIGDSITVHPNLDIEFKDQNITWKYIGLDVERFNEMIDFNDEGDAANWKFTNDNYIEPDKNLNLTVEQMALISLIDPYGAKYYCTFKGPEFRHDVFKKVNGREPRNYEHVDDKCDPWVLTNRTESSFSSKVITEAELYFCELGDLDKDEIDWKYDLKEMKEEFGAFLERAAMLTFDVVAVGFTIYFVGIEIAALAEAVSALGLASAIECSFYGVLKYFEPFAEESPEGIQAVDEVIQKELPEFEVAASVEAIEAIREDLSNKLSEIYEWEAEVENVAVASAENLVNPEYDKKLIDNVSKAAPLEGYDDVLIHGLPDSFWYNDGSDTGIYLDQRQLANCLKSKGITSEDNIRLISCESGALEDGIAQDLANEMGTNVLAPTTKVITSPDGSLVLGDYDAISRTLTVEGTWNLFSPENESVTAVYSADSFANMNYLKRYFNVLYK